MRKQNKYIRQGYGQPSKHPKRTLYQSIEHSKGLRSSPNLRSSFTNDVYWFSPGAWTCELYIQHFFHFTHNFPFFLFLFFKPSTNRIFQPTFTHTASGCGSDQPSKIFSSAVDQFSHLPNLQRNIMNFIVKQPKNEVGIHVPIIAQFISANGLNTAHEIRYEHNLF